MQMWSLVIHEFALPNVELADQNLIEISVKKKKKDWLSLKIRRVASCHRFNILQHKTYIIGSYN